MNKLYFESIDDNICQSLDDFIGMAKHDGKQEITLIEAIPDKTKKYCWCNYGACVERSTCNKRSCDSYEKPQKGNVCACRGKLYTYGESVTFDVKTGNKI
ncbi:hypothetical protein [uncultured Bacteroides sp.]|uniref:hypothetical protein n=1 Tax=uncultured Bacteroides sp. TaxID=162156 RepID=UPI002AAC0CEA|nr:hypothetical protein [uncultured Bacteroides sp.]